MQNNFSQDAVTGVGHEESLEAPLTVGQVQMLLRS